MIFLSLNGGENILTGIFLGYIFMFIDFKILGIDVFSDFLGYILIYVGLGDFHDISYFQKARPVTFFMTIATILYDGLVLFGYELPFASLISLFFLIVWVFIIYLIDMGIKELEEKAEIFLYSQKLIYIWKLQAIFLIGGYVLAFIDFDLIDLVSLFFLIAGYIVHIVFLVYLYRVKNRLESMT